MRQAALPAAARFTCQSDSSRQCFGHPCLPARTRSLPTRQCFRWQSDRDRCTRPARLRSSTWFQHLGSRRGAEDVRQYVTRRASTRKVSFVHAGLSGSAFWRLGLRFISFHLAFVGLRRLITCALLARGVKTIICNRSPIRPNA